jgi:hypothetical protein
MKITKIFLSLFLLLGIGLVPTAEAAYFDVDSLNYPGGSSDIESDMEGIYGSDITVTNAIVGDGVFDGPLHDYDGDLYMQSNLSFGVDWFEISFKVASIISVSFD